ncbi:hypothetical protein HNQ50_003612 [Silvimonas terrae]|uniref:Winged helix DNA-binding protein n=1 Tax=Silvimonas terrae TaxID=300266 RepID=A0A840RK11_9NEIS|nr:hypothetical protein [Silvimonas terrae]MBB5192858.1 hypothetical protein [Silvimonas terrae]
MEETLIAIMALLAGQDGLSDHQVGKKLELGMSQLNRALTVLTAATQADGQALVRTQQDGKRRTLWLTEAGRALCP